MNLCGKTCLPPTGLATGQLAPWIIWQIWCARNQFIFEGKNSSAEETLTKAISMAREWTSSQEKKPSPLRKTTPRAPLTENCMIVNTDAAWRSTNLVAGLGWTVKTPNGSSSFMQAVHHVGSALSAEGLAVREALTKCKALGIKRVICKSDSSQLVSALSSGESRPELYRIVSDVLVLLM